MDIKRALTPQTSPISEQVQSTSSTSSTPLQTSVSPGIGGVESSVESFKKTQTALDQPSLRPAAQPQNSFDTQIRLAGQGILSKPALQVSPEAIQAKGIQDLAGISGKSVQDVESISKKHGIDLVKNPSVSDFQMSSLQNDLFRVQERVKDKLDNLSEMGEMESLRLQMAMDRLSKIMSTLSNLLKKTSEEDEQITRNVK